MTESPNETQAAYGLRTTTLLVVASMVGTGVFATTGILLPRVHTPLAVLLVWVVGGLSALAGALSYAEVASAHPESGGEYALLGKVFHPAVGFAAGVVSIVAGFAAPIAACAIAFGRYVHAIWPVMPELPLAAAIIVGTGLVHARSVHTGARFQDLTTAIKVALVVAFAIAGAVLGQPGRLLEGAERALDVVPTPGFAVSLVLVYFAYTGWNAASYVAGEIHEPQRTLPRALAIGTLSVTALYVLLNVVFLAAVPRDELDGVVEVGHVAAIALFGPVAGSVLSAIIAFGLVSTIGAFAITGTSVCVAMARDHARLRFLGTRNVHGAPVVALAVQAGLALVMALTASFDALLTAVGFTLSIASALVAAGCFVVRARKTIAFRAPLHPLAPLTFIAIAAWTVFWSISEEPATALAGLGIIVVGLVGYLAVRARLRP